MRLLLEEDEHLPCHHHKQNTIVTCHLACHSTDQECLPKLRVFTIELTSLCQALPARQAEAFGDLQLNTASQTKLAIGRLYHF